MARGHVAPAGLTPLDFGSGIAVNIFDSSQDFTFLGLSPTDTSMIDGIVASGNPLELPGTRLEASQPDSATAPEWKQLPMYIEPTNKLDEIVINKSRFWRGRILKSGRQITELGEPRFPSISSLINQPLDDGDNVTRPVSDEVAAEVLDSPVKSLVERIGFTYKLSYFVR